MVITWQEAPFRGYLFNSHIFITMWSFVCSYFMFSLRGKGVLFLFFITIPLGTCKKPYGVFFYKTMEFSVVHNIHCWMDSPIHPIVDLTGGKDYHLVMSYFHCHSNHFSQIAPGSFSPGMEAQGKCV